jgi:hypothetical protein
MHQAIPPLPLYAFKVWTGTPLPKIHDSSDGAISQYINIYIYKYIYIMNPFFPSQNVLRKTLIEGGNAFFINYNQRSRLYVNES